KAHGEVAGS
ncbi:hypothetical protein ECNE037_2754, partial [Escherichia coli NE037]